MVSLRLIRGDRVMTDSSPAQRNEIIHIEGNTLTFRVGEYRLSIKIEGPEAKQVGRLQMEKGQTLFDTVLQRAKSRLLKLYDRVKNAPFLQKHRQELEEFLAPVNTESGLFVETHS